MKKYNQLLLLILTVTSLTLFLIYRHEYNKLHYVLEVFNFFGHPCNFSDLEHADLVLNHQDWGPEPVWQDNELSYIYSAFLDKNEVQAVATYDENLYAPKNCYVWNEDKAKPSIGHFKATKIGSGSGKQSAFKYSCTVKEIENKAYAVSFGQSKRYVGLSKIMLKVKEVPKETIGMTICVVPFRFDKKLLVEFISFHKLMGISSFIFYNQDIPYRISKMLLNLSTRLEVEIAFLSYNFPTKYDNSLTKTLVETDCLLRTSAKSKFVTTLEINEFLVPKNSYNLLFLTNSNTAVEKTSIPVQKFCIDQNDSFQPIILQNVNTFVETENHVKVIYKTLEPKNASALYDYSDKNLVAVHKYVGCNFMPNKVYKDESVRRFSKDLTTTTLMQIFAQSGF